MNIALIVAGGKGSRITSDIPKQFVKIGDKPLICYTLEKFEKHPQIDTIFVVCLKEWASYLKKIVKDNNYKKICKIVLGGETRQDSVRNGLNEINCNDNDIVLIHDADRPFIDSESIDKLLTVCKQKDNAVLAVKKDDIIQGTSHAGRTAVYDNVEYLIQTPQCFRFKKIKDFHNRLKDTNVSDDASLYDLNKIKVNIVEGKKENIKITTDLDMEYLLRNLKENNV